MFSGSRSGLPRLGVLDGAGDHDGAVLDGGHHGVILLHHLSGDLVGGAVKVQIQAVLRDALLDGPGGELAVDHGLNGLLGAGGEVTDGAGDVGLGGVGVQVAVEEDGQEVVILAGIEDAQAAGEVDGAAEAK